HRPHRFGSAFTKYRIHKIYARACPMNKQPWNIDEMLRRIEDAVASYPKAALFELWDHGHTTPFEQLVACIISIRTRDETMLPVARQMFLKMKTPAQVAAASLDEIDNMIRLSAFHYGKAISIRAIAERCVAEYGGELPCDEEIMLSLPG